MSEPSACHHLACLHVPRDEVSRFDLLMGRWPGTPRPLPPDLEAPWTWFRYLQRESLRDTPETRLWLDHFPELIDGWRGEEAAPVEHLLRTVLARCHVRSLHYGFAPPPRGENLSAQRSAGEERDEALGLAFEQAKRAIEEDESGTLYGEQWTLDSPLGRVVEDQVGLLGSVRRGESLEPWSPSIIVGLLQRSGEPIDVLTPRQLEELVAALFECEGWSVELTPASKDGGKDLIARREDEDGALVVYAEVKHWSPNVPVRIVREFVGVMAIDQIKRGYLVTSGAFTSDALDLARQIGQHTALVEPVNGAALQHRLETVNRGLDGLVFALRQESCS